MRKRNWSCPECAKAYELIQTELDLIFNQLNMEIIPGLMINQELTLIIEVLVVIQDLKLVVIMHLAEVIIYLDLHQIVLDHPQFLDPTQALDHTPTHIIFSGLVIGIS